VKPVLERTWVERRRAKFEYTLHDTFEAGISLLGSEVKSMRAGQANLGQAYIRLSKGSAFLVGCHISGYEQANRNNHEPVRERQLLLKRPELDKLRKGMQLKGMTIVPLRLYLKGSLIKLELALAKGKNLYDKRETLKAKDQKRDMDRRR
jgi:SsrA-binding protein